MAFDAFFLRAVLDEMHDTLIGSRVEKLYQPVRDTVILQLKNPQGHAKLMLTVSPSAPRVHLTETKAENPASPPMFCMLLRKHLSGARISAVYQPPMERCTVFTFDCTNEMGDPVQKKLVAELMGRTCNLYLLDSDGRILDCLRRVGLDESAKRPALPGMYYTLPDPITKKDPLTLTDYTDILRAPGADVLAQRLMDSLGGLSPLVCREAALFAAGDPDARLDGADIPAVSERLFLFFSEHLNHAAPYYCTVGGKTQFAFCPIRQYGACTEAPSFCALLDTVYAEADLRDTMRQKSQAIRKTVTNLTQRLTRKLALQEKELAATYDRERLRQLGDILTANLHRMQKGQESVTVQDFYDEAMPEIQVKLSPLLSPQQNAAKYYKDYSRMKTAEKELTRQIALGKNELSYLQSVSDELDRVESEAGLEEIRQELQDGGYLRGDGGKRRPKQAKLQPMRFESTDGFPILVGRNNRQNEELTFRMARKDDLWLHASKVPGSHVILSCGGAKPSDDAVTQAAQLAAYYSASGGGQNVAVDVTEVRQVKKPSGGKPGMVIYHTYRTVIANPFPTVTVDPVNAERP